MTERTAGIHHLTAIASDPARNLDFYTRVLGLHLVKRTVNFDDPGTYHFYLGDAAGHPGTLLTFLPEPGVATGTPGTGEVSAIAFAVPEGSLAWWSERLARAGFAAEREERFGEQVLAFHDRDGVSLELIESPLVAPAESGPDIDPAHAIRGLHSATLRVRNAEHTIALLTGTLGLRAQGEQGTRRRFRATNPGPGTCVDLIEAPDAARAHVGTGSVHHIAWRAPDDGSLARWLHRVARTGLHVTPIRDRRYFRSIYFRERGGVLHEIATETPGFAVDETRDHLGEGLQLPDWLEPLRARIERMLPSIEARPAH